QEHRDLRRQRLVFDEQLAQRRAAHQLDYQEALDVFVAGDIVDFDDVRVAQLRHRPRLTGEASRHLGVLPQVAVDHLDGNFTLEPRIARSIDGRHAPVSHLVEQLVLVETREIARSPRPGADLSGWTPTL